ncbi:MAG: hypothetical protein K2Z80_06575, partial [Xanthobacteraceae bacterium]|nr:hypothetical protein [Xanthobacteraceae bacterium]
CSRKCQKTGAHRSPTVQRQCEISGLGLRLVDAVTMPVEDVMRQTGLPRPEAKIIRGDVAGWCGEMFAQLDKLIAFGGSAHE